MFWGKLSLIAEIVVYTRDHNDIVPEVTCTVNT